MVPLHSALQGLSMSGLHCSQVVLDTERDRISSKVTAVIPQEAIDTLWDLSTEGGAELW